MENLTISKENAIKAFIQVRLYIGLSLGIKQGGLLLLVTTCLYRNCEALVLNVSNNPIRFLSLLGAPLQT